MTTLAVESSSSPESSAVRTLADVLHDLGDIPPFRVIMRPPPGTATEEDVVWMDAHTDRLCELVDGVLVEKAMGYRESMLACYLIQLLGIFVRERNLGLVSGEAGMMRLFKGLVRIPDVAYIRWAALPGGKVPTAPVPKIVPDLAVEILSESNTAREMDRKLAEYFTTGVRLVWIIDPDARTVTVYTAATVPVVLSESDTLTGGEVLPGFTLPLKGFFAELDRTARS